MYGIACVVGHFKRFGQLYLILIFGWMWMAKSGDYNELKYKYAACNFNIDTQNSAIEDLQIKTLEHQKEAQEAAKKADILKSDYDKRIAAIQKEQVPNECIAAIKWGINQANDL